MEVIINDTAHTLNQGATLLAALSALGISTQGGIAVAVNGTVAPKNSWDSHKLSANDKILVIRVAQGG